MFISQATLISIISVGTWHKIFFINEYIIKSVCILKLVRVYLGAAPITPYPVMSILDGFFLYSNRLSLSVIV